MTKVHRELLSRLENPKAVTIDSSYGFQENVADMTQKLLDYFNTSLSLEVTPLSFTSFARSTPLEQSLFKQQVRDANYVFAGPGSPSYAVEQWKQVSSTRARAAWPSASSAAAVSATSTCGQGTGRETSAAAAPRSIAPSTQAWPSACAPVIATNRSPV